MDRAQLPQDPISGNVTTIGPEHAVIHDGTHFTLTYNKLVNSAASVSSVYFTTPSAGSAQYTHFVCGVETDKAATWTFSEDASASVGSALTVYNNNRNSTKASLLTLFGTPTITTVGTVLETHIIGTSGNPNSQTGGGVEARNEWLLKPSTNYLIQITTVSASTNTVINMPYYYRA